MNESENLSLAGQAKEVTKNYILNWPDEAAVKFYIAMLSLSLILGLLYCGFLVYKRWSNKTALLSHISNLVIALLLRTFFSLLVASIVYLDNSNNSDGINTLLSFECIFLNLVLAYWCILSIYIHGKARSKEVDMTLYSYGLPAVALYFAFVWIFVMTSEIKTVWIFLTYIPQWIVQSVRLIFLIVQLALVIDIVRLLMVKKNSLDNDCKSLLKKLLVVMLGLLLVFWLQFGFSTGAHLILYSSTSYFYFWCFIDGFQLALLCPMLYFFETWGGIYLNGDNFILTTGTKRNPLSSNPVREEVLCKEDTRNRISTIQSIYADVENEKSRSNSSDVVFSSVVGTKKLQKTMNLYNRFNMDAKNGTTYYENEEFFDCIDKESIKSQRSSRRNSSVIDVHPDTEILTSSNIKTVCHSDKRVIQQVQFDGAQKKNAFYKSKYLIVDEHKKLRKSTEKRPSTSPESKINVAEPTAKIYAQSATEKELPKSTSNVGESQMTDNLKIVETSFQDAVKTKIQNPEKIKQSMNEEAEYNNRFMNTFTEKDGQNGDRENYHSDHKNVNPSNINDDASQTAETSPVHQFKEFNESGILLPSNNDDNYGTKEDLHEDAQTIPEFHPWKSTKGPLQEKTMPSINMHAEQEHQKNSTLDVLPTENNINYARDDINISQKESSFRYKKIKKEIYQVPQNIGYFQYSLGADENSPEIEIHNSNEIQKEKKKHRKRNSISSNFYNEKKQFIDNSIGSPGNNSHNFDNYENPSPEHTQFKKIAIMPERNENTEVVEKDGTANFETVENQSRHGLYAQQEIQFDKDSQITSQIEEITNHELREKQNLLFRALFSISSIFSKEKKAVPAESEIANDPIQKTPKDSSQWGEAILRDIQAACAEKYGKVETLQPQEDLPSNKQVLLNFEGEKEKVLDGTNKEENINTSAEKGIENNFREMKTAEKVGIEDIESVKMTLEDEQDRHLEEKDEALQTQENLLPNEHEPLNFAHENYLTQFEEIQDDMWYLGEKIERQSKKIEKGKENTVSLLNFDEHLLTLNKIISENEMLTGLENLSGHKDVLFNLGNNSLKNFQELDKDSPLNLEHKTKNISTFPDELYSSIEHISPEIYDELVQDLIEETDILTTSKNIGIIPSQEDSESEFDIENCHTAKKPHSYFELNPTKTKRSLIKNKDHFSGDLFVENLIAAESNKRVYSSSESEFECELSNRHNTPIRRIQSDPDLSKAENFRLSADTESGFFRYSVGS